MADQEARSWGKCFDAVIEDRDKLEHLKGFIGSVSRKCEELEEPLVA